MIHSDSRLTVAHLHAMAGAGERIAGLTAYDASFARVLDEGGVDFVLVGDSLGMTVQGGENTQAVTMADMIYHTRCVAEGIQRALLISDMPYQSFRTSAEALTNASALIRAGAQMVKLETCTDQVSVVEALVQQEIPVCAHLGLRPQSLEHFEGVTLQGRDARQAQELRETAAALIKGGAGMLLLECVHATVATEITQHATVPVIGIGSGADCDGQILVLHDVLGLTRPIPRHARNFLASEGIKGAIETYVAAVRSGEFP